MSLLYAMLLIHVGAILFIQQIDYQSQGTLGYIQDFSFMNEHHWGPENWILFNVVTYDRVPYLMGLIQLHQNRETLEWVPIILELVVCLSKDDFDILYCYVRANWGNSNINKKRQWQSVVFSYLQLTMCLEWC